MKKGKPELSIIITSYKNPELLKLCLESIQKNVKKLDYEIIVVDSSTEEPTHDLFREGFKNVHFISNKKNKGFGGLVNQGLNVAKGEFLFIINADIIVKDDVILKLLVFIKNNEDVGIVAPKLINFDNSVQQSCFRFYSPLTILYRRTILGKMSFAKKPLSRFLMKSEQKSKKPFSADWVMGSAMMTKRTIVDKVGPYDKRYFMYFEDVDWCRRFWEQGFKVIYNPHVRVFHYHGRASASKNAFSSILFNKYTRAHIVSSLKYFIKFISRGNPHEQVNKKIEKTTNESGK